ncbi:MAG: hypothetical protein IJM50_00045 [Lachnospiraceae bacterium]|nr:hypothetical protein [Lachnospiraceae bacterium]
MKVMDIIRCVVVIVAGLVSAFLGLTAILNKRLFTLKHLENCTEESVRKASRTEGTLLLMLSLPLILLAAAEFAQKATAPVIASLAVFAGVLIILLYILPRKHLKLKK